MDDYPEAKLGNLVHDLRYEAMTMGIIRQILTVCLTACLVIGIHPLANSQATPSSAVWQPLAGIIAPAPAIARPAASTVKIPVISIHQLPPEAQKTLTLIEQGGPFPYRKDGTVFGNREGLLPRRSWGYYREYTVPTPGSRDRGARRIVTGQSYEYYYTGDHYRSFSRIKK